MDKFEQQAKLQLQQDIIKAAEEEYEDDHHSDSGSDLLGAEESTAFDDVALSLLLFFMVTSLFVNIEQAKQQESGKALKELPAAGGYSAKANPPHVLNIKSADGVIILEHIVITGGDESVAEVQIPMESTVLGMRKLKKSVRAMITEILPNKPKDKTKSGILVAVRLPRNLAYKYFVWVWYALIQLDKKDKNFKSRVASLSWGSGSGAADMEL